MNLNKGKLVQGIFLSITLSSVLAMPAYAATEYGIEANGTTQKYNGIVMNTTASPGNNIESLYAHNNGVINILSGNSTHTSTMHNISGDGFAYGLHANGNGSSISVDNLTILTLEGKTSAIGILGENKASNTVNMINDKNLDIHVTSSAGTAYGIVGYDGATNDVGNLNILLVEGKTEAVGIGVFNQSTDASVTNINMIGNGALEVTVTGSPASGDGKGYDAVGICAQGNGHGQGLVTVTGVKDIIVNSTGTTTTSAGEADTYGVGAFANGYVSVNAEATGDMGSLRVTSQAKDIYGVFAENNSTTVYKGATDITITTNGESAYGIYSENVANTRVDLSGDLTVKALGASGEAEGITAAMDGVTTVNFVANNNLTPGNLIIESTNVATGVQGMMGETNLTMNGGNVYVTSNNDAALGFASALDIANEPSYLNASVKAQGIKDININGKAATGIVAMALTTDTRYNAKVEVEMTGNLNVTATDDIATGVLATGPRADVKLNMDKGDINVTGATASIPDTSTTGILSGVNGSIVVNNAHNINVTAPSTETVIGICSATVGRVTANITGDITVDGGTTIGIDAESGGSVNLKGNKADGSKSIINSNGTNNAVGIYTIIGGNVNLENIAVKADGSNQVAVMGASVNNEVHLNNSDVLGKVMYDGSGLSTGEVGALDITLDATSTLTGMAQADTPAGMTGGINITNAGIWTMTADSNTGGTLVNNGLVEFAHSGSNYLTLTNKSISGSGIVQMNANLEIGETTSHVSDKLVITENAVGKNGIYLVNTGNDITIEKRMLDDLVITPASSTGTFIVVNDGDNKLEHNLFVYELAKEETGTGWYLRRTTAQSNKTKAVLASVNNPDVWYVETEGVYNTAATRDAKNKENLWAMAGHSKLGAHGVDTKFNGVQVGFDKAISSTNKANTYVGVTTGYGKGDLDYVGGTSELASTNVGVYGIYKTNDLDPFYVSSILKYNRYTTDVHSTTGGGVGSKGDFGQHGWGLSVMTGKRFNKNNGWFVEPQIELGFHKINGTSYSLDDLDAHLAGTTSKRVRGGVSFGKAKALADGSKLNMYLKASLVHEFGAATNMLIEDKNYRTEYGGTWGQYRLGANLVSKRGNDLGAAFTFDGGGSRRGGLGIQLNASWKF